MMMEPDADQSVDDSFWAKLAATVRCCQGPPGTQREAAWSQLGVMLRDWTRGFSHRKGLYDDQGKNEFSDYMLSWLAGRGRLSSFDPERGNLFTWLYRALEMGYADYVRDERSFLSTADDADSPEHEADPDIEARIREARDEIRRLPTSLRTSFKAINLALLGPLDDEEAAEFCRLFGAEYTELCDHLDRVDGPQAAALLGKSADWAYQVRCRALKWLREVRDESRN